MKKQTNPPIEGKAIRFAPGRNQEPVTALWKVWAQGSEVYAMSRSPGGTTHISVHASGEVHYRREAKEKQDLAPLMQLWGGPWFHAFEIRFLWSAGALSPLRQRESLKQNQKAYLIRVPDGYFVCANLVIGSAGIPLYCPLPPGIAGQTLWRTQLRDGRIAVLVGRLLELDDHNRGHIRYFREELGLTATVSAKPASKYFEIHNLKWSTQGGNVILVVPMGEEAFRSEQDFLQPGAVSTPPRHFYYRNARSAVDVIAPNGFRVAVIELADMEKQIELVKGLPKLVELGSVTMRIEPSNLIAGSEFIASPCRLVCCPTVSGACLRAWDYMIHAKFDGSRLTARLHMKSISLQNRNLATPVNNLESSEELVIAIPAAELKLTSTLDLPSTSTKLLGRFTLGDRR